MVERDRRHALALDVGGANIKAAHSAGGARVVPFELWKRPEELPRVLQGLAHELPPFDVLAVTMTAELCDCYASKAEGVSEVLGATMSLAPQESILIWSTSGRFLSLTEALRNPLRVAAANWLALATVAGREAPSGPGLVIDIGTTTTDLIPLNDGRPVPRGRSDTERLQTGELVYAGVRRTPVCALGPSLRYRGLMTGLAAELFATTHDVYLTLGMAEEDPTDLATADGRPATVEAARGRLARMVGADSEGFSQDDARELAGSADALLLDRLEAAARRACSVIGPLATIVTCGSGSSLARRVGLRMVESDRSIISLADAWGPAAAAAGCAHALLALVQEKPLEEEPEW